MRLRSIHLFIATFALLSGLCWAENPSASLQASNTMNPNISAIGWFQAEAGHRQTSTESDPFQLKEIELGFQSFVDTYARADIFASFSNGEAEIEEGYLTWFALPGNLALKIGKFKANFGHFNRSHTPETSFADRPLVEDEFFGEEGLSGEGASVSWNIPNPWVFLSLDAEAMNSPDGADVPGFDKAEKGDLTYIGRLGSYFDLTEASNISLGGSYAHGPAGQEFDAVDNSSTTLDSMMYGLDLTYRWKNPRHAVYRSFFWTTEVLWNDRELSSTDSEFTKGMFSHIEYQFLQRWRAGGRYDYTQTPGDRDIQRKGGLLYITFTPSEFSSISLQGRHVKEDNGTKEDLGFLKVTFNIGPHGAHPF